MSQKYTTIHSLTPIYDFWFNYKSSNIYRHWIPIQHKQKQLKNDIIYSNFSNQIFEIYHLVFKLRYSMKTIEFIQTLDNKTILSIIIILDQFTRNLSINFPNLAKFKKYMTHKSTLFSFSLLFNHRYILLNPNELIFLLMPLKHIDIRGYMSYIHSTISYYCTQNQLDLNEPNLSNLQYFYIDCLQKYYITNDIKLEYKTDNEWINYINRFSYICEFYPENYDTLNYWFDYKLSHLENSVLQYFTQNNIHGTVTISLSGGVDSMVLTYVTKKLSCMCPELGLTVQAFHLNYNNRAVSNTEMYLIQSFCEKLNIPLYTYNIEYVKRRSINRESYEMITHKIRFKCYRSLNTPIILGHISEDCIENIITNFATNKHMFNLQKIKPIDINEGVTILRPFINMTKEYIYEFASVNGIPHLLNTTPEWSNRGKFRNTFLNQFKTQYGEVAIDNITKFSDSLSNYGNIIDKLVINPKVQNLISGNPISFITDELENIHLVRTIFTNVLHSKGLPMPSIKSVENFVSTYKTKMTFRYQLTKDILLLVNNGNITISI